MVDQNIEYTKALKEVVDEGIKEYNERTQTNTTRKFGVTISLNDVDYIPLLNIRKMYIKTVAAELAWSILGTQETDFINKHAGIWKLFEDTPGIIKASYGYRWRKHFGRDQLNDLVSLLDKEPSSRQGVVVTWDAATDGLLNQKQYKNVPCPYSFTCNVIDDKLNMMVAQRSADMVLGLPYDIAMYAALNNSLASSLNKQPGNILFSIADAHVYECFDDVVKQMFENNEELIQNGIKPFQKEYSSMSIKEIENNPDKYVDVMKEYAKNYTPLNNIRGLKNDIVI